MIDEKKLIEEIKRPAVLCEVYDIIKEMPKVGEWIPFTGDEDGYLDCEAPDIDEEILVSDGNTVWEDIFMSDEDGCYLERNVNLTGVAWMPLPEPWKVQKC